MAAAPTTATAKMVPTTNVCLQTHSVLEQVKRQYEFRRNHNNILFYFFDFLSHSLDALELLCVFVFASFEIEI